MKRWAYVALTAILTAVVAVWASRSGVEKAAAGKAGLAGFGRPGLLFGVPLTVASRSSCVGGSKLRLTAAKRRLSGPSS